MVSRRGIVACALLLLAAVPAWAGSPTDRLRDLFGQANRVLLSPEPDGGVEARVDAVRDLVDAVFDPTEAAALALGSAWDERTPAEREEFARLYADLVARAYMAWVGSKARVGEGGVRVAWTGERIDGAAARVGSAISTRSGSEFPVEYDMVRREGRWVVRDVLVDGVSLAASYHAQFQRVLQLSSYAELRARLYDKASARTHLALARSNASRSASPVTGPRRGDIVQGPGDVVAVADPPRRVELVDRPVVVVAMAETPAPRAVPVSSPAPRPPVAAAVTRPPVAAGPVAPVASAAPASRAPGPADGAGQGARRYWVQVGAFRQPEAAARAVEQLPVRDVTVAVSSNRPEPLARVLVGPFADRAAAMAMVRQLTAAGFRPFVASE